MQTCQQLFSDSPHRHIVTHNLQGDRNWEWEGTGLKKTKGVEGSEGVCRYCCKDQVAYATTQAHCPQKHAS